MKNNRILGLDIIRSLAVIFVFITHYITINKVLDVNQLSIKWTIYMILRFLAMSCVPLFLLLTGYLNSKKELNKKYYKGIVPLYVSYLCISVAEIVATSIYLNEPINWKVSLVHILNFTANGYAWYFEMYIGLFFIIPFLNILYDNLKNKKEKMILLGSLVFLTLLPQIFKSFKFGGIWFDAIPDYWQITYPITYFYIGKMIKEFKPKFSLIKRILMFCAAITVPCIFCYIFSTETEYAWYIFNGFESLTNALTAISIFLLFYDFDKRIPILSKVITEISICSFEMYLFSSVWDKALYSKLHFNILIMILLAIVVNYVSAKILITIRDLVFRNLPAS